MAKYTLEKTLQISSERVKTITQNQSYIEAIKTFIKILDDILANEKDAMYGTDKERDLYMYRQRARSHWYENIKEVEK